MAGASEMRNLSSLQASQGEHFAEARADGRAKSRESDLDVGNPCTPAL